MMRNQNPAKQAAEYMAAWKFFSVMGTLMVLFVCFLLFARANP